MVLFDFTFTLSYDSILIVPEIIMTAAELYSACDAKSASVVTITGSVFPPPVVPATKPSVIATLKILWLLATEMYSRSDKKYLI